MNMATLFASLSSNFSFPPRPTPPLSLPTSKSLLRCFSSFNFHSYSSSIVSEIDHQLNTILAMRYPETLHQSMRNSVLNLSSDHFFPILSVASCELLGGERASIIPTACAIQIARAASILHDEQHLSHSSIPDKRMAVLTGEALFFRSFECVVSFTPPGLVPEFIINQVVAEISKAVGSTGVAGGQLLISCEKEIIWMLRRKFGAMAECSAVCGGLVGGAGEDVVNRLRKYGMAVGVLHQVMDEILLMEDSKMDQNNNGVTLLSVVGIERAMEMVEELKSEAIRELDMFEEMYGETAMPLRCILDLKTY